MAVMVTTAALRVATVTMVVIASAQDRGGVWARKRAQHAHVAAASGVIPAGQGPRKRAEQHRGKTGARASRRMLVRLSVVAVVPALAPVLMTVLLLLLLMVVVVDWWWRWW